jgi:hypothetical protein
VKHLRLNLILLKIVTKAVEVIFDAMEKKNIKFPRECHLRWAKKKLKEQIGYQRCDISNKNSNYFIFFSFSIPKRSLFFMIGWLDFQWQSKHLCFLFFTLYQQFQTVKFCFKRTRIRELLNLTKINGDELGAR